MRIAIKAVAVLGVGALIIGCGGGGEVATTQAGSATTTTGVSGEGTTSTVATTSATTAGGEGTAAGVCELVTADELAQIFNVASVTTAVLQGPPDSCIVESDSGDPLTAWSLTTDQAQAVFDALSSDPSSIEVTGIGDSAFIVENTGLLVLKGGRLIVISISGGADLSEDEAVEASKRIGEFAASRL